MTNLVEKFGLWLSSEEHTFRADIAKYVNEVVAADKSVDNSIVAFCTKYKDELKAFYEKDVAAVEALDEKVESAVHAEIKKFTDWLAKI